MLKGNRKENVNSKTEANTTKNKSKFSIVIHVGLHSSD